MPNTELRPNTRLQRESAQAPLPAVPKAAQLTELSIIFGPPYKNPNMNFSTKPKSFRERVMSLSYVQDETGEFLRSFEEAGKQKKRLTFEEMAALAKMRDTGSLAMESLAQNGHMSAEEINKLSLQQKNGETARKVMIEKNLRLVFFVIKNSGFDPQAHDAFSDGMLGLIRAVDLWNPDLGFQFSSYAYFHIKGKILNEHNRRERKSRNNVSLDKRLGGDHSYINATLHNFIPSSDEVEKDALSNVGLNVVREAAEDAFAILKHPHLDKIIFEKLYVEGYSEEEVSEILAISRSYVSIRKERIASTIKRILIEKRALDENLSDRLS